jgi:hypothetical protein
MKGSKTRLLLGGFVAAVALVAVGGAAGHPGQHGLTTGHLIGTGDWGKIEFVEKLKPAGVQPDTIADLTVFGNYVYLAKWGATDCAGPETGGQRSPDGGVYIIDISNPAQPREVGFIATHQDTLVGEGMQVIHITTPKFTGDVLLMNHEGCGKNYKGGVSLWDVTDPLKPKKLSEHFGDITIGGVKSPPDVNQTHSAFMWDAGDKAYLISVDDEEPQDVDIYDITDPKKPRLIAELDLNQFGVSQPELQLTDSFLHDLVVKNINGRWIGLLSYWDGGWVLLDLTNPASPVFLGDTDYPAIDPELLQQRRVALSPEGNAHQAEFTIDNRYFIGTDEDFGPYRVIMTTDDGDSFRAAPGTQTTAAEAEAIAGTTVFVGRACPGDPAVPPAPDVGTAQIAVVERGLCTFEEKAQAVLAAGGYEAMIIMNREGSDACTGILTPSLTADIPTVLIGRDAGFQLFDRTFDLAACLDATPTQSGIPIGTIGDVITDSNAVFDGWGYVHLYGFAISGNTATFTQLDTFAIPQAMDPGFASGFGDLSVHEVAVDPLDPTLAYLSYYSGGLRAIQIQQSSSICAAQGDTAPCLVEVGGYLDPLGNEFWGVETQIRNGETYIFASDMDSGLWIFRDP